MSIYSSHLASLTSLPHHSFQHPTPCFLASPLTLYLPPHLNLYLTCLSHCLILSPYLSWYIPHLTSSLLPFSTPHHLPSHCTSHLTVLPVYLILLPLTYMSHTSPFLLNIPLIISPRISHIVFHHLASPSYPASLASVPRLALSPYLSHLHPFFNFSPSLLPLPFIFPRISPSFPYPSSSPLASLISCILICGRQPC